MIVSVVTPSFNQGEFIEETIRSVLEQKGDFFLDYIIMDGGSSDNSVAIIRKYAELINDGAWPAHCNGIEYRWISQKDNGQSDAINRAFAIAKGDIGVWLNSDDYFYDSDTVSKVVRYFSEDVSLELLIGDGWAVDRNGNPLWRWHTDEIDWNELIYLDYHILQPAAFAKLALYTSHPLITSYHYCMDQEFFVGLLHAGVRYHKVDDDFACLRFYPQTKTLSGGNARFREAMEVMRRYGQHPSYRLMGRMYQYSMLIWRERRITSGHRVSMFPHLRNLFYYLILGKRGR